MPVFPPSPEAYFHGKGAGSARWRQLDADPPATPWGGRPYDLTRYDARGQVLFLEVDWELL